MPLFELLRLTRSHSRLRDAPPAVIVSPQN
jgi:hypothetical protein